jgi:hypothetical protein
MEPTKLPDSFFPSDDQDWQRADYQGRVALLVRRFEHARVMHAGLLRQHGAAMTDREMLRTELRSLRDTNAQLVRDVEQTGAMNANLLRQLAYALEALETEKVTKGQ